MSVETPETFREQTLEWQSSHARELALAKQDITALKEENERLKSTLNALERRIERLEVDDTEDAWS